MALQGSINDPMDDNTDQPDAVDTLQAVVALNNLTIYELDFEVTIGVDRYIAARNIDEARAMARAALIAELDDMVDLIVNKIADDGFYLSSEMDGEPYSAELTGGDCVIPSDLFDEDNG